MRNAENVGGGCAKVFHFVSLYKSQLLKQKYLFNPTSDSIKYILPQV